MQPYFARVSENNEMKLKRSLTSRSSYPIPYHPNSVGARLLHHLAWGLVTFLVPSPSHSLPPIWILSHLLDPNSTSTVKPFFTSLAHRNHTLIWILIAQNVWFYLFGQERVPYCVLLGNFSCMCLISPNKCKTLEFRNK